MLYLLKELWALHKDRGIRIKELILELDRKEANFQASLQASEYMLQSTEHELDMTLAQLRRLEEAHAVALKGLAEVKSLLRGRDDVRKLRAVESTLTILRKMAKGST